jgi:TonB family protein
MRGAMLVMMLVAAPTAAFADVHDITLEHSLAGMPDAPQLEHLLADKVALGPVLFANASCRTDLGSTPEITGKMRVRLAACLVDQGLFHFPDLWPNTYEGSNALFAFQLRDHKVVAIGPHPGARGKEAKLPTFSSPGPEFASAFQPPAKVVDAIDRSGGAAVITFLSCSDGKSPVTTRVVATSRYPAFDRSAVQFVAKANFPLEEFSYQGQRVAACMVWGLGHASEAYAARSDGAAGHEPDGEIERLLEGEQPSHSSPPPSSPPPPAAAKIVSPSALEKLRIAGVREIPPDLETKAQISADRSGKVAATLKFCIATDGAVWVASLMKSSGYKAYDEKLAKEMKTWKFNPFLINGKPTPACTAVTFTVGQAEP